MTAKVEKVAHGNPTDYLCVNALWRGRGQKSSYLCADNRPPTFVCAHPKF